MTTNTDPLDLAYVAIGAAQAWEEVYRADSQWTHAQQYDGGQLEYIAKCTAAQVLDYLQEVYDEVAEAYGGIWVYDVCEPFGRIYGMALLLKEEVDFETLIIELVCDEL